jgi:hypothetical protein
MFFSPLTAGALLIFKIVPFIELMGQTQIETKKLDSIIVFNLRLVPPALKLKADGPNPKEMQ